MRCPASVVASSPATLVAGAPVQIEQAAIEQVYREESARVLATLIRLLGSFDLAEEAMQEAFAAALEQWPRQGTPVNPRAWLVSTGRHKAVDLLRRRARFENKRDEWQRLAAIEQQLALDPEDAILSGETLRGYHLLPAARGDFARRLQQWESAAAAYRQALSLTSNEAERRFLGKRLAECESRMR